ncbi:MAG: transposase, partial [Gammaproteobacteria bacterium]
ADKTVRYTAEVKRQMVALARSGRTPASLSREFGVSAMTIGSWIKQDGRDTGQGDGGLSSAEREELQRPRQWAISSPYRAGQSLPLSACPKKRNHFSGSGQLARFALYLLHASVSKFKSPYRARGYWCARSRSRTLNDTVCTSNKFASATALEFETPNIY